MYKRYICEYYSESEETCPTSDTPLHDEIFRASRQLGWKKVPKVSLHGHELETEAKAIAVGAVISTEETMFSTPEDAAALRKLLESHSYPENTIYVRKGHGFVILAHNFSESTQIFEKRVIPAMRNWQEKEVTQVRAFSRAVAN